VRHARMLAAGTAALVFGGLMTGLGEASTAAVQPPSRYPRLPQGTAFLDHGALLGAVEDPAWFEANIPFLDVPDQQFQSVYYYRWQTYKEHLVYTGPEYGWLSNEFLQPVAYGAPYGGISAAAGHQITEGRWLRDQQYTKDVINYWLNGPGQFPKPMEEFVNPDTSDWAHEYSFWAASSVWQHYLATGDRDFAVAQQPALVKQYNGWGNHFNANLGLYWQVPVYGIARDNNPGLNKTGSREIMGTSRGCSTCHRPLERTVLAVRHRADVDGTGQPIAGLSAAALHVRDGLREPAAHLRRHAVQERQARACAPGASPAASTSSTSEPAERRPGALWRARRVPHSTRCDVTSAHLTRLAARRAKARRATWLCSASPARSRLSHAAV